MRDRIALVLTRTGALLGYIAGAIIMFLTVPVVYSAIARDIGYPTNWGFEIMIYALITGAFLANAEALKSGNHFRVKAFLTLFPKAQIYLDALAWLATLIFGTIILIAGCKLSLYSYLNDIRAPTLLNTPIFIPQAAIPLGGLALMLQSLAYLVVLRPSAHLQKR